MWICPKCKENIEDQFDSCWKCVGIEQPPTQTRDLAWVYPVISLVSSLGLGSFMVMFWHSPKYAPGYFDFGGVLIGIIVSSVGIWAFLSCPMRHWFAKILTLCFLVLALFDGVLTVGSFLIHIFEA